jgi:hypothetical protein
MATRTPIGENTPETDNSDLLGKEAPSDVAVALAMQKRIAELEAELAASKSSEQKAIESAAHNAAAAQNAMLFTSTITEVQVGENDDGDPMWKYKIDLPPSGGTDIRVNMTPYYHGETYTFDTHLLRTIKEMVQRAWGHEASIQGSNENFYRREMNQTINGRGR